jgi:transglutaminase-like putative cysteine protease
MRSAARTIAVAIPALVVVAAAWLRLEEPVGSLDRVALLLVLALAAAAPGRGWLRALGALAATVVAVRIVVGVDLAPWRLNDPGSGFGVSHGFSTLGTRYSDGFSDFYGTHLPFDPRVHVAMHELVLSGIFVFALAVTLLVAARKPVAGGLVLLAGAGWPATLLGPSHGIAIGAAILVAELVLLAGLGSRRVPALAIPAAVVVAAAAVAVGSATAARHGLVHWQSWNLAHIAGGPVGVGFVWDAQYGGLRWSGPPTAVLDVRAKVPPSYLRATVLDDFQNDRWVQGLPASADSLEPKAAFRQRNQTREDVTVQDLAEPELVGGSIPMRFSAGKAPLIDEGAGFESLDQDLPRGFHYTVWSHTARPSPAALRRSPPDYPIQLTNDGLLDVGHGVSLGAFGAPNRSARVLALVAHEPKLAPYLPLARLAEDVAGGAADPYDAVESLQSWFLSSGGFRYSNHPTVDKPALVGFVTRTKAGYCQFFAGAMALMLRYLGIPARVAVGFAGGTYEAKRNVYVVTDRDAHAWVEVWFKGYGWLPFDPTPAASGAAPRTTIAGAAKSAPGLGARGLTPAEAAAGASAPGASTVANVLGVKNGIKTRVGGAATRPKGAGGAPQAAVAVGSGGGGDRGLPVLLLLAVLGAAAAAVVLAKAGVRTARTVRRDPRGVAAACRRELAAFLVDQRIEVPRSATLGELGELVRHEFGANPEGFVAAGTVARFGPPERAAAAAVEVRHELRLLLAAARRGLTLRERLRGLLSVRSLMRPVDATPSPGTEIVVGRVGS